MHPENRYRTAKRVTLFGALVNALLGCIKVGGGLLFHSHALLADGVHSFADLITDAMVVFASKYGSQHADDNHPYGHQRIETAATFCLAMLLILTGIGISWEACNTFFEINHPNPGATALPIALISIAANEGLFYLTKHIGQRIHSALLIANAWHHRSDAASSLIVVIGLLGSWAGYRGCDAIAAILVGLLIVHMGLSYGWNSIKELVDTSIDQQTINQIKTLIQHLPGVIKIHQLRSRSMGRDVFIDVHIQVAPCISVSEGHYIAQQVHYQLIQAFPTIKDVTVHVDPEDDEISPPSLNLPNRETLEQTLLIPWRTRCPAIDSWTIHYLAGAVTIDLVLHHETPELPTLRQQIRNDLLTTSTKVTVRCFTQLKG